MAMIKVVNAIQDEKPEIGDLVIQRRIGLRSCGSTRKFSDRPRVSTECWRWPCLEIVVSGTGNDRVRRDTDSVRETSNPSRASVLVCSAMAEVT
jgi:hypothetical protein